MPRAFAPCTAIRRRRNRASSRLGTIACDCAVALALFGLLLAVIGWTATPLQPMTPGDMLAAGASPEQIVTSGAIMPAGGAAIEAALPLPHLDAGSFLQPTDRVVVAGVLASIFAAIIAFNLWFLRHLGRVYASSRPGGGRRG